MKYIKQFMAATISVFMIALHHRQKPKHQRNNLSIYQQQQQNFVNLQQKPYKLFTIDCITPLPHPYQMINSVDADIVNLVCY